ncbi:MAG TPA: glycosyltransferase family 4 protein [Candidatus Sulfotelmatobacter sp.]|nr:glycosyltransferase family 4 protein [Candidatus Sulfotelmatobacter sp.]
MRVLYFSDNASDHNRRFLEKLAEAGLQVWFLDPTTDRLPDGWLPQGVQWLRTTQILRKSSRTKEFEAFLPEFLERLAEVQPDLVHAGPTGNCGYLTALASFHPWLLMSWGSDILYQVDRDTSWKEATQLALSTADGFFCDCEAVRLRAGELANIPKDRIVQLPWGIRNGSFTPEGDLPDESEFVREPGTQVLISTRSWEPIYGIDVLLEAFKLAYKIEPALRLVLLGGGSGAARVRDFIRSNGLERAICLPGHVGRPEMAKWFRAAHIYVSCTASDGTSISLLEAMASGLPVVVSDLPANREWVKEGKNGWLAPVNSAEAFAHRLLRAARLEANDRRAIAERNRRIVAEKADWDANFPKLLAMYERLTVLPVER